MDIKVPSVGESVKSGILSAWLKNDGDSVREGDPLFELETEKATVEVPSAASGVLKTEIAAGTEVVVEQRVGMIEEPPPGKSPTEGKPAAPDSPAKAEPPAPAQAAPATPPPAEPVPAAARQTPGPGRDAADRERRVPMSMIRKRTAQRLTEAKHNAAHLTTFNEIDMQAVMALRARCRDDFEKEHGVRLGFMSFFVKACARALAAFPEVNAAVDGEDIVYHDYYDIGVAVSTDKGLLVPILRGADRLTFAEVEQTVAALAGRARDRKLGPDELTGGTFTITNGGIFGSLLSTPIPAYPQSAVLGMHAIKKRPVVVDDEIAVRPMMYVALTYDHRLIDGRQAVSFLKTVKELIEDPGRMLLAGT